MCERVWCGICVRVHSVCVFCECVECAVSDVYVCGVWVGVNVLVPGCV